VPLPEEPVSKETGSFSIQRELQKTCINFYFFCMQLIELSAFAVLTLILPNVKIDHRRCRA